jgi:hypothetical protein
LKVQLLAKNSNHFNFLDKSTPVRTSAVLECEADNWKIAEGITNTFLVVIQLIKIAGTMSSAHISKSCLFSVLFSFNETISLAPSQ